MSQSPKQLIKSPSCMIKARNHPHPVPSFVSSYLLIYIYNREEKKNPDEKFCQMTASISTCNGSSRTKSVKSQLAINRLQTKQNHGEPNGNFISKRN